MNPFVAGLLCLAAWAGPALSQSEEDRSRFALEIQALSRVATVLQPIDDGGEYEELIACIKGLGAPEPAAIERTGDDLEERAAIRSAARTLKSVAASLGGKLRSLPPEERHRLARVILRLDGMQRDANETLGNVWSKGRWIHVSNPAVSAAVRKARALPVSLEIGPSEEPLLKGVPDVWAVKCNNVTFHTDLPRDRAETLFREVFRAAALDSYLRGGRLEVPAKMGIHQGNAILVFHLRSYRDVFENARKLGWFAGRQFYERMAVPANWLNGIYVAVFTKEKYPAGAERHCFGAALLYLSWRWWELESHRAVQPYLACGLLNWICLNHHHSLLPLFKMDAVMGFTRLGVPGLRVDSDAAELHGYRSRAVRSHKGFTYPSLLAATFGVDFLIDRGDFARILEATRYDPKVDGSLAANLVKGLGESLDRFDARWRRWVMDFGPGLAQRLEDRAYP